MVDRERGNVHLIHHGELCDAPHRAVACGGGAALRTDARGAEGWMRYFVTIWRRAPLSEWKVVLDVGNGLRE
jgi:hypothetical protein